MFLNLFTEIGSLESQQHDLSVLSKTPIEQNNDFASCLTRQISAEDCIQSLEKDTDIIPVSIPQMIFNAPSVPCLTEKFLSQEIALNTSFQEIFMTDMLDQAAPLILELQENPLSLHVKNEDQNAIEDVQPLPKKIQNRKDQVRLQDIPNNLIYPEIQTAEISLNLDRVSSKPLVLEDNDLAVEYLNLDRLGKILPTKDPIENPKHSQYFSMVATKSPETVLNSNPTQANLLPLGQSNLNVPGKILPTKDPIESPKHSQYFSMVATKSPETVLNPNPTQTNLQDGVFNSSARVEEILPNAENFFPPIKNQENPQISLEKRPDFISQDVHPFQPVQQILPSHVQSTADSSRPLFKSKNTVSMAVSQNTEKNFLPEIQKFPSFFLTTQLSTASLTDSSVLESIPEIPLDSDLSYLEKGQFQSFESPLYFPPIGNSGLFVSTKDEENAAVLKRNAQNLMDITISSLNQDKKNIQFQLQPEHLGRIDINLEMSTDKKLKLRFTTDTVVSSYLLEKNITQLEQVLVNIGYQPDSIIIKEHTMPESSLTEFSSFSQQQGSEHTAQKPKFVLKKMTSPTLNEESPGHIALSAYGILSIDQLL